MNLLTLDKTIHVLKWTTLLAAEFNSLTSEDWKRGRATLRGKRTDVCHHLACSLNSASSLLIAIAFLNGRISTFKCPKRECHARHSFYLPHRSAILHTDLACEQALCLDLTRDLFWAQAAKGLGRGRDKELSLPRLLPNLSRRAPKINIERDPNKGYQATTDSLELAEEF